MEIVDPIRSKEKIEAMKRYLRGKNVRDYLLFVMGISSALRVSDLRRATVGDVWNGRTVNTHIRTHEQKNKKYKQFAISKNLEKAIKEYIKEVQPTNLDQYLFISRQTADGQEQPISRSQAYRIIHDAAEAVNVKGNIGVHSLRKTWGYHAYKAGYPLALISEAFNHSSEAITRRYIGITQDEINEVYINLNL